MTRQLNLGLWQAVAKADPDQVKSMIGRGADVDAAGAPCCAPAAIAGNTPLWASVSLAALQTQETTIALFEALRESSLVKDKDDPRRTRKRYLGIIGLLIDAGADLEKHCHGATPLRIACINNDLEVARILLRSGADPDAEIYSPLSKHAKRVGRKVVPGYCGTILHEVVSKGYQEATAMLIKAGADPSRVNDEGRTALDIASRKGYTPITKLLEGSKRKVVVWKAGKPR